MTNDITNLIQQMYDYFLNLFHQTSGTTAGASFLTFEPVGTPITPNMFKLHPADSSFSEALATEVCSSLANIVPAINANLFMPTGKVVDDFYGMLLAGSQFDPQSGDSTLFDALKRQWKEKLDQNAVGSMQGPFQIHPAYAMPRDWYDPASDANWTAYSFGTGTASPSVDEPPPRVFHPPVIRPWTWQVVAPEAQHSLHTLAIEAEAVQVEPPASHTNLGSATLTDVSKAELTASSPVLNAGSVANRLHLAITPVHGAVEVEAIPQLRSVAGTLSVDTTSDPTTAADTTADLTPLPAGTAFMAEQALQPTVMTEVADREPSAPPQMMIRRAQGVLDPPRESDDPGSRAVRRPLRIGAQLAQMVATARSMPVASHSLSLSLKYCLITLNRPWFSEAFLSTPGWYLPGFAAGAISHGTAADTNDPFPALPVACLVAKDLRIAADWSELSGVAQQSAAFGPFSLVGQTVDQTTNTLTVSGMQIIGWICQIMPVLPPVASPAT